jgi:hypothetical protein
MVEITGRYEVGQMYVNLMIEPDANYKYTFGTIGFEPSGTRQIPKAEIDQVIECLSAIGYVRIENPEIPMTELPNKKYADLKTWLSS